MIRYFPHDQIDKQKWDICVDKSFNTLVYASSWYLDIVSPEWAALIWGDYDRIMPLTFRKKWGICYVFQPPFTQQLGVFSRIELSPEIMDRFIGAIPDSFQLIEININSHNRTDRFMNSISANANYELDLIRPYDDLFAGFSENRKRNIRSSVRQGVTVRKNLDPVDVIRLYTENLARKYNSLSNQDELLLKRLAYQALYKGQAEIYGAYTAENTLCAGAIFLISEKRAIFLFSGYDEHAAENHGMSLLIDRFIADHSPGPVTLDFEGSNNPGLARFYASFGSSKCTYNHLYINRMKFPARLLFKGYKYLLEKHFKIL